MTRYNLANNPGSILAEDITAEDTSIVVEDASSFPEVPFLATLNRDEIVAVIEASGNIFTVERGQEGKTAKEYTAGTSVDGFVTAGHFKNIYDEIDSHKADYRTFKEETETTIGTESLPTTSRTIKGAIAEVFTIGNNVKGDTVNALLSVDDGLPISENNKWSDIIDAISQVETGLTIEAGDVIFYEDLTRYEFDRSQNYRKFHEVSILAGNIRSVRASVHHSRSAQNGTVRTIFYVNGVPASDEITVPEGFATADIRVKKGDVIQVYSRTTTESSKWVARVQQFQLGARFDNHFNRLNS